MKITKDRPDYCPLCGSGNTDFDSEEHGDNRYPIRYTMVWRCYDCGCRWVDKYTYTKTEVYTEEEWED